MDNHPRVREECFIDTRGWTVFVKDSDGHLQNAKSFNRALLTCTINVCIKDNLRIKFTRGRILRATQLCEEFAILWQSEAFCNIVRLPLDGVLNQLWCRRASEQSIRRALFEKVLLGKVCTKRNYDKVTAEFVNARERSMSRTRGTNSRLLTSVTNVSTI